MMTEPRWLKVARKYDGLAEIPGPQSNPMIITMARAIGAPSWYHNDDQPWCAVFANFVLLKSDERMALGSRGDQFDRLRALSFLELQHLSGPALGAIAVFSRPEGAHVGFYIGEHRDPAKKGKTATRMIRVFGGNQGNRVCETWIDAARLRGYRWPLLSPLPSIRPVLLSAAGAVLSTNEA